MSRPLEPYTIPRRWDSNTFQITLNCSSGLPWKAYREWRRRSFRDFPDALASYRNPKTKTTAKSGAIALIANLTDFLEANGIVAGKAFLGSDVDAVSVWRTRRPHILTNKTTTRSPYTRKTPI